MGYFKLYLFAFLVFIVISSAAQTTVYNNFGAGNGGWDYNWGLGWTVAGDSVQNQFGVEQAMGFESTADGVVSDIWLAISYVPLSPFADTVIIRLAEDPSGLPPDTADVLEEWILTDFGSWSQWNPPIHLAANHTSELMAGNSYWIWAIAKEATWTMWCMNEDPALTCPHTLRRENEDWLPISNETASAFRVDITQGAGFVSRGNEIASLSQNFPNPFTTATSIAYVVSEPGFFKLVVYDPYGREIKILADDFHTAGEYLVRFDASGLSPGVYCYRLMAGQQTTGVNKMYFAGK